MVFGSLLRVCRFPGIPKEWKENYLGRKLLLLCLRLMIIFIIGTRVVLCCQVTLCITQQLSYLAQGCTPEIAPEGEECSLNRILLSFSQNMSVRAFIVGHCIYSRRTPCSRTRG